MTDNSRCCWTQCQTNTLASYLPEAGTTET
jgi:hypothetical protein